MAYDTVFAPKGLVRIRDEDGNVLFEGHNMVVKSGRNELFKAFTGNSGFKKLTNLKAYIGNNSQFVTANDGWDSSAYTKITSNAEVLGSLGTVYTKNNNTLILEETPVLDNFTSYYNENGKSILVAGKLYYSITDMVIHFGLKYVPSDSDNGKSISTFGLVFDNDTLFSRIVIPERIINENTPLIFDYYLYF